MLWSSIFFTSICVGQQGSWETFSGYLVRFANAPVLGCCTLYCTHALFVMLVLMSMLATQQILRVSMQCGITRSVDFMFTV